MSQRVRSAWFLIVAMFGFAGLVFADSGTPVKHIGPGSKIAKPLALSDQDAAIPSGNDTPLASAAIDPPANDTCAGAQALTLGILSKGTTIGANNDYQSPATTACFPGIGQILTHATGRDVVYSFTAPGDGNYTFRSAQQHPNNDPIANQDTVLYLTDCANEGEVTCFAGANHSGFNASVIQTQGQSNNRSDLIPCYPMTSGETVYLVFDDGIVGRCADDNHRCYTDANCNDGVTCVPDINPGSAIGVEVKLCNPEVEPNDSTATATPYVCDMVGTSHVAPTASCQLGTRAGAACTLSGFINQILPDSDMRCSGSGARCIVDTVTGLGNCAGPGELCQQQAGLDCDPRCDIGPNAGKTCATQAFCNPVSDQGATCAGTCQRDQTCINDATGADTGVSCYPVCVGGLNPGRYCSGLSGCPGGGVCTGTVAGVNCQAGETCSVVYNEGDVDFYSLGTPEAGSKVFASIDASNSNDYDYRMRVTTATNTLQFDDDDVTSWYGTNSSTIAGAVTDGTETFVRVSRTQPRQTANYELYAHVRPPIAAAQLEDESGPTGNDIYYGWPGDVINANPVTAGGYVIGTMAFQGDSDCFKFLVNEGDLMDWFGDANPDRVAGAVSIVDIPQPIIYDAEPAGISNYIFGANPRKNTAPDVQGAGLNALSPAVTSSWFQWRASYTGMLEVCYYGASAPLSQGTPSHPNNWAGSLTVNCGPVQSAGPGTTTADVSVTKTGPAGPVEDGSFVDYTITVVNNSAEIAQEVTLLDFLDLNLTFVSLNIDDTLGGNNTACFSLPDQGDSSTNESFPIYCINTSMAPGSTTTYTLTVQVNNCIGDGVTIINDAFIFSSSTDENPDNDFSEWSFDTAAQANNGCTAIVCDGSTCFADACLENDHCVAGVCQSDAVICNDDSVCTDDSCNSSVGCVFDSSNAGDLCDDFNPCTDNACDPVAFCVFPPAAAGGSCDDGLVCTVSDQCDGSGNCAGSSVCDDGNACTDDFADELNACACSYAPVAGGTACSDNDACTEDGTCDGAGTCVSGGAVTCDDGDACTIDTCDSASGCVYTPLVCTALDQCHVAGSCDSGTGLCDNPTAPDGTLCDDGNAGTGGDTCQAGICVGVATCDTQPQPKSSGYFKKLCKKGIPRPNHGDMLTDADAECVGQLTTTFAGITTATQICEIFDHEPNGGPDWEDGEHGNQCTKADYELMGLALNICRQNICPDQEVDSACGSDHDSHNRWQTTVSASLATTDALLSDPARNKFTCKDARCLAKEINNGKGVHQVSLTLAMEAGNHIRLSWENPVMDDGSGAGVGYSIWRRALNADAVFVKILETTAMTYVDLNSGTDNWEYEVTFTVEP